MNFIEQSLDSYLGVKLVKGELKPRFGLAQYCVFIVSLLFLVGVSLIALSDKSLEGIIAVIVISLVFIHCIFNSSYLVKDVSVFINNGGLVRVFYKNREVVVQLAKDDVGRFNFANPDSMYDNVCYADGTKISSSEQRRIIDYLKTVLKSNGLLSNNVCVTTEDYKGQDINWVYNTDKLQGWRNANSEELKVAKGLLLYNAKSSKSSSTILKVFLAVFSYVSIAGALGVVQNSTVFIREGDFFHMLLCLVVVLVLGIFGVFLGVEFVKGVVSKSDSLYLEAIKNDRIRVNDVEIYKLTYTGVGNVDSPTRCYARVKDCCGTYCNEEGIEFICTNVHKETKGLIIEVIYSDSKGNALRKKCVIACREYDPKIYEVGMNYYNKYYKG